MCCGFIFCVRGLSLPRGGGGVERSKPFGQHSTRSAANDQRGVCREGCGHGLHVEHTCKFSLGLGEFEVSAWLIRLFISPSGMCEPAGQGLKSACFGGNSRLAGEAWSRVHVGVLFRLSSFRLSPVQRPRDGSVGRFHSLSNEPGWIPVPGVNRRNWRVFPVDRLRPDAAPVVVRLVIRVASK